MREYVCLCLCACAHAYMRVCVSVRVRTCVQTCVCMCACLRACHVNCVPHLGQDLLVLDDVLVGGEQHVELAAAQLRYKGTPGGRRALGVHKRRGS